MVRVIGILLFAFIVVVSMVIEENSKDKIVLRDKNGKRIKRRLSEGFLPGDILADYPNDPFFDTKYYLVLETRDNRGGSQYVKIVGCNENGDYPADHEVLYASSSEIRNNGWELVKNIYKVK